MPQTRAQNGSEASVPQSAPGTYPTLPEGQGRIKTPPGGVLQSIDSAAAHVMDAFQNRMYADRKSIARTGAEVGLSPTELAGVGSALLFHMDSPDEATKLEATRALFKILGNNSPFDRDKQAKDVHDGLNDHFWKKVLNDRRDETFLRVPEVRSAAEESVTYLQMCDTHEKLRKMTGDSSPERAPEAELRDRWERVLEHKLHVRPPNSN